MNKTSDEIDLLELLKKIYNSRKKITYLTLIFIITGVITSLVLPASYTSSTVFIPQNQETNNTSLSGVASLVGINLGSSNFGGEIPSSMYPQITKSPRFKKLLLSSSIDIKGNLKLREYIIKEYNLEKYDNEIISELHISKLDEACYEIIDNLISIEVNIKDGFITLSATTGNAEYSTILTKNSKEILQKIIIDFKIESAQQNLIFSQNQLAEKRLIFDEIQSKLAYFTESNQNSVNSFVNNQKNKLEAEFGIINAVVTELSKQVEEAKLQVTKDTPVFSTIKEAVVPNLRSSPKRKQIVIIFTFVGFIFSIFYSLLFNPLKNLINEIKNS